MLHEARCERRTPIEHIAMATVYPDRDAAEPYEEAVDLISNLSWYEAYNVFGVVEDASDHGLGLRYRGQNLLAQNILKAHSPVIVKVVLSPFIKVRPDLQPYLLTDGRRRSVVLRAHCRWNHPIDRPATSHSGIEVRQTTPERLRQFVVDQLVS